jgi:hypothetical protein
VVDILLVSQALGAQAVYVVTSCDLSVLLAFINCFMRFYPVLCPILY